ncbi:MAG: hypothetical protein ACE366_26260 [Bradymonadia bacterium]
MQTDDALDQLIRQALAESKPVADANEQADDHDLDDGAWAQWALGTLSDAARDQVEGRLAADAEARALAQAQREPVSEDLAQWALEQWVDVQSGASSNQAGPSAPAEPAPTTSDTDGKVVSLWGWRAWPLAAAAAVAITVGSVLWSTSGVVPGPQYTAGPLMGSARTMRSEEPGTGVFLPDSRLQVDLKPPAERETFPQVVVYAGPESGPFNRIDDAKIVQGFGGALRLKARAGDLFADHFGPSLLAVSLGPWSQPPATLDGLDDADRRQWLRFPVDYRKTPPSTGEQP